MCCFLTPHSRPGGSAGSVGEPAVVAAGPACVSVELALWEFSYSDSLPSPSAHLTESHCFRPYLTTWEGFFWGGSISLGPSFEGEDRHSVPTKLQLEILSVTDTERAQVLT